jgi:hypothetical protein
MPDASASTHGDPTSPKQWTGPWLSLSDPEQIAKAVIKMNIAQYHQAHHMPFGSGSLAESIGRRASTPTARAFLWGDIPSTDHLLPEAVTILRLLSSSPELIPFTPSNMISEEEFSLAYKAIKETTSSSPSGQHVGHYKAVINDLSLVQMNCTMMSLPFMHGFTPCRWERVVDVMLQKEEGNSRCSEKNTRRPPTPSPSGG